MRVQERWYIVACLLLVGLIAFQQWEMVHIDRCGSLDYALAGVGLNRGMVEYYAQRMSPEERTIGWEVHLKNRTMIVVRSKDWVVDTIDTRFVYPQFSKPNDYYEIWPTPCTSHPDSASP